MNRLPHGWAETYVGQLGAQNDVAILTGPFGSNLRRQDFRSTGVPVLTIGCLSEEGIQKSKLAFISHEKARQLKNYSLRKGDFLFSRMATVGRVGFVPEELDGGIFNYHLMRLRLDGAVIEPRYFFHFVRGAENVKNYLEEVSRGATRDGINTKLLTAMPVWLAPKQEQIRIVEKLDYLRSRLASADQELVRVSNLIERYRDAILRSAFKGELTQDWRKTNTDTETVPSLLSRIESPEQPRGGREATDAVILGMAGLSVNHPQTKTPRGWQWTPLLRVARQETGHTPSRSKPKYWNGGIPWIGIKDAKIHHGKTILETLQTVSREGLENSSARLLPKGTVCLSRTASVGYVTIMGRSMCTSQDFATWTCTPALLPKFLMYALMAEGDDIRNFGEGSTHTTIYFPEIRALNICLPPIEEQAEIVQRVEKALAWIEKITTEHARAEQLLPKLDQAILVKAFRGELVPQDPKDEPASLLLVRTNSKNSTKNQPKRGRARKT